MALVILPDPLLAVLTALRASPELAAIVGDRIGTEIRTEGAWPTIRVDLIGGDVVFRSRIDGPRFDVHAFDPDAFAAHRTARVARAVLDAAEGLVLPDVLVIGSVTTSTPHRIPDDDRSPPVAHFTFAATITVRPDP